MTSQFLTLMALGLITAAVQVNAQATTDLQPLLVTATRSDADPSRLGFQTERRDAWDLQTRRQVRTTPEALRELPSVLVQKTAHGQGSPFLRGWTGFRTLMLVDGVRLNNSVFRDGPNQYWNTIDPFSIERMEVVMGGGSVMNGSDAVGGTVQVFTQDPLEDHGSRVMVRGASAEQSLIIRGEHSAELGEGVAARVGVTTKSFGDLETGSGKRPHTGYEELDLDAKLAGRTGQGIWTLAWQQVEQDDVWRTHKTIHAVPYTGSSIGSELRRSMDQTRRLAYAKWQQPEAGGIFRDWQSTLSWHEQSEARYRERSRGRRDLQGLEVQTLGFSTQAELGRETRPFTVGVDLYRDAVDSYKVSYQPDGSVNPSIQGPVGDDATYLRVGSFAQWEASLCERSRVLIGVRGEHAAADVGRYQDPGTGDAASLEDDWQSVVASVRLTVDLDQDKRWLGYAGISQGFRAPNLSDLTRLDSARSNEIETPSPGLDPEEFLLYEIGFRKSAGVARMELAAYYTDVNDLIVRSPTGVIVEGAEEVQKRNAGAGYVAGVELSGEVDLCARWTLFAAAGWMEGEVDTYPDSSPAIATEPISRLMPFTAHSGLRFTPGESVWLEALVQHAEKADRLSTRDSRDTQRIPPGGTPSYTVVHLRGSCELSESLSLSLAVENVANENYRVHGSGLNEPGRNVVATLDWRF